MKIKKFLAIFILSLVILSPALALAQEDGKAVIKESGEGIGWICKTSDSVYDCVPRLYDFALGIAGLIAVGVLVAAGYLRMTSGGDGKQLTTAKEMGGAVAAGLLLLLTAYVLLRFLNPQLVEINRNPEKLTSGSTSNDGYVPGGSAGDSSNPQLTCSFTNVGQPSVSITSPSAGSTLQKGSIAVTVAATGARANQRNPTTGRFDECPVKSVQLSDGVRVIGTQTSASVGTYNFTWDARQATNGTHVLVAQVTDTKGQTQTHQISVNIAPSR